MSPLDSDVNANPRVLHARREGEPDRPHPNQHRNPVLQHIFENYCENRPIFDRHNFDDGDADDGDDQDDSDVSSAGSRSRSPKVNGASATLLDHSDCPKMEISHLKVEDSEGQRGLAKLLFVGAGEHINRAYDQKPWIRRALISNWSLSVYSNNDRAKKFYKKVGMEEEETERHNSLLKEPIKTTDKKGGPIFQPWNPSINKKKLTEDEGLSIGWTRFTRKIADPAKDPLLRCFITTEIPVQRKLQLLAENPGGGRDRRNVEKVSDKDVEEWCQKQFYAEKYHLNYEPSNVGTSSRKRKLLAAGGVSALGNGHHMFGNGSGPLGAIPEEMQIGGSSGSTSGTGAAGTPSSTSASSSSGNGTGAGTASPSKMLGGIIVRPNNAFLKNKDRLAEAIINSVKATLPRSAGHITGASTTDEAASSSSSVSVQPMNGAGGGGNAGANNMLHPSYAVRALVADFSGGAGTTPPLPSSTSSTSSTTPSSSSSSRLVKGLQPPVAPLAAELTEAFATDGVYDVGDSGSEGESDFISDAVLKAARGISKDSDTTDRGSGFVFGGSRKRSHDTSDTRELDQSSAAASTSANGSGKRLKASKTRTT
ncbi:unnamed protein product [Amoebophrya sp. A25]|nr:unnamed protein product [Amoebophrya sp. A25]|eukprot:GSA25T00002382001.1